jgi:hypothetical protein
MTGLQWRQSPRLADRRKSMTDLCSFQTTFDIEQAGFTGWRPIMFGLAFVAVGALLVLAPNLMSRILRGGLQGNVRPLFGWIFLSFALLWTYASYSQTYPSYRRLLEATQSGRVQVVEGFVEKFHPMPKGGHDAEHFEVNGVTFGYSDYSNHGGFNNTASHGGPMREGLYARVAHVDRRIVRLEIRQPPPCSHAKTRNHWAR